MGNTVLQNEQHNHTHLYVIGSNNSGEFGLHHLKNVPKLKHIENNKHIENINCGYCYSIYTHDNNTYLCAGDNVAGQCGIGNFANSITKYEQVKYFKQNNIKIQKICTNASSMNTFWITNNNKVYGNGMGLYIDLIYENVKKPTFIKQLSYVIGIKSGNTFNIALCKNSIIAVIQYLFRETNYDHIPNDITDLITIFYGFNQIYIIGKEASLGSNDRDPSHWTAAKHFVNKSISRIAAGSDYSLFLESNGNLWSWGKNNSGQLGIGYLDENKSTKPQLIQYFITNKIKIKDIECGLKHTLSIDYDDRIYSFGSNCYGQCGDGTSVNCIYSPKFIDFLKDDEIEEIKCGSYHSYAKNKKNQHFLWGSNTFNECILYGKGHQLIPFCINHIVTKLTHCNAIKSIYPGHHNTKFILFSNQ